MFTFLFDSLLLSFRMWSLICTGGFFLNPLITIPWGSDFYYLRNIGILPVPVDLRVPWPIYLQYLSTLNVFDVCRCYIVIFWKPLMVGIRSVTWFLKCMSRSKLGVLNDNNHRKMSTPVTQCLSYSLFQCVDRSLSKLFTYVRTQISDVWDTESETIVYWFV